MVTPRPSPAPLPPDVDGFTGREAELALLDAERSGIVVLSGLPGSGKTALAVHWGHRAAGRFPDGRFLLDLRGSGACGPRDPADALRLLLEMTGADWVPDGLDARTALWRTQTADRRMLLILDDADDIGQVRPLLPGGGGVRTVVTSRRRMTEVVAAYGARPVVLDVLPRPAAIDLLRRRLGDDPRLGDIVDSCGRLPLALALATARARLAGIPPGTLAAELRRPGALDEVHGAFRWSYERLNPAAARLFRLLGLVAGPDLAVGAVAALAGRPDPEVHWTLRDLADAGLVRQDPAGRYAVPDPLRAYAADLTRRTDAADDRRVALIRLLDHYTHSAYRADLLLNPARAPIPLPLDAPAEGARVEPLDDLKTALGWLRSEREALLAAVRQARAEGLDAQAWQLSWALDSFLAEQGRWDDEGAAWAVALESAAALTHGPATAYAYAFRAVADGRRQRFETARAHLTTALGLTRDAGDRAGEGECLFLLSYVCWLQGDPDEALARAEESLDLFRRCDHPMWAGKASLAIGWYHAERGALHEALPYYQDALAEQRRAGDRPNEAVTLAGLGWLQHRLGDYEHAVQHLSEGLRLARRLGDPALQSQVLGDLGDVHETLRDRGAAEARWREALEIAVDLGHPQAAELRRKLAAAAPPPVGGLGGRLRDLRVRCGMSQEDLAARTGLSVRTIRHIESGRAGTPRPETLRLLGDALDLAGAERQRFYDAALAAD